MPATLNSKGGAIYRGLVRIPILARLIVWMRRVRYVPRHVDEAFDRIASLENQLLSLLAQVKANEVRTDDHASLIKTLRRDVQDLQGESPISGSIYEAFEMEFRGDPVIISQRVEVYLPIIESVSAGIPSFPVLDVGCGRGEWLHLLKERGLTAIGIDSNKDFVDKVRGQGLQAEEVDAIYYLTRSREDSVGAVTAFHLVEHLPLNALIAFIREAYRIVRPGGVVIFETPNPENVIVGSCTFYTDPTHRSPIPPATLAFYLRHVGFSNVTVTGLAPLNLVKGPVSDNLQPIVDRFNMGQDYAAIGYKL